MIDFHRHLDLYPDPQGVAREYVARELYILSVTTTPSAPTRPLHSMSSAWAPMASTRDARPVAASNLKPRMIPRLAMSNQAAGSLLADEPSPRSASCRVSGG